MDFYDVLDKRKSFSVYDNDRVPTRDTIREILKQSHEHTPVRTNQYNYRVHVFGPEHYQDKVRLCSITASGSRGDVLQNVESSPAAYDEIQDSFFQFYEKLRETGIRLSFNGVGFNSQVIAPYLLIYTSEYSEVFTPSQWVDNVRSRYLHSQREKKYSRGVRDFYWVTQASMSALMTSLIATEKGLDSSFMGCFNYHRTDAIFTLSLGYRKTDQQSSKGAGKPLFEEIVKFN